MKVSCSEMLLATELASATEEEISNPLREEFREDFSLMDLQASDDDDLEPEEREGELS